MSSKKSMLIQFIVIYDLKKAKIEPSFLHNRFGKCSTVEENAVLCKTETSFSDENLIDAWIKYFNDKQERSRIQNESDLYLENKDHEESTFPNYNSMSNQMLLNMYKIIYYETVERELVVRERKLEIAKFHNFLKIETILVHIYVLLDGELEELEETHKINTSRIMKKNLEKLKSMKSNFSLIERALNEEELEMAKYTNLVKEEFDIQKTQDQETNSQSVLFCYTSDINLKLFYIILSFNSALYSSRLIFDFSKDSFQVNNRSNDVILDCESYRKSPISIMNREEIEISKKQTLVIPIYKPSSLNIETNANSNLHYSDIRDKKITMDSPNVPKYIFNYMESNYDRTLRLTKSKIKALESITNRPSSN